MRIIADLHTHTRYSHGRGTIGDHAVAAADRGLAMVAITEHGPRSAPGVGASVRKLKAMCREVERLNRRAGPVRVLTGVECNVVSAQGDVDLPLELLPKLDLVLVGLHPTSLPLSLRDWWALTALSGIGRFCPSVRRKARTVNTRALVEAVLRHDVDVVTHPGLHRDIDTAQLARACALRGTAMEINARHGYMTVEYCQIAAAQGVRFVINSDAHDPRCVGQLEQGIAVARAAGLRPEQVINSDRGGVARWLEERRRRRVERV